eukprot:GHVP01047507.1.p1 GENE.GHVP01047507.1~~GHVP01047507.1.p1  ORF type:complete len:994 (-),score=185.59 GHVP01047507.1:122-3103(-)
MIWADLKAKANTAFSQGNFNEAILKYLAAIEVLKESKEEPKDTQKNLTTLNANLAQCYLKVGNFFDAISYADEALAADSAHQKARFRKAKALFELHRHKEAMEDAKKVFAMSQSPECRDLLRSIQAEMVNSEVKTLNDILPNNLLKKVVDANCGNEERIEAAKNLREMARKGQLSALLREPVYSTLSNFLIEKTLSKETVQEKISPVVLEIWKILEISVMPPVESVSADLLETDVPFEVSPDCQTIREILSKELLGNETFIRTLVKILRSAGGFSPYASNSFSTQLIFKEIITEVAVCLNRICQYCSSIFDENRVQLMLDYAAAFESPYVQTSAIIGLTYLSDALRRKGSKGVPLKLTPTIESALRTISGLSGDMSNAGQHCQALFVNLWFLLTDSDRPDADIVDATKLLSEILEPYVQVDRIDTENQEITFPIEEWSTAFRIVGFAALARRDSVKSYLGQNSIFLEAAITIASSKIESEGRNLAARTLALALEFEAARSTIIAQGGVSLMGNLCQLPNTPSKMKAKLGAALSRLALHDGKIRQEIFEEHSFLKTTKQIFSDSVNFLGSVQKLDENSVRDQLRDIFDILLFLSFHGEFKASLVDTKGFCSKFHTIGQATLGSKDVSLMFMFVAIVYNMVRSKDTKEKIRKTPGMPDLDDNQLEELRSALENLPDHAKPKKEIDFQRGDEALVEKIRKIMIDENIPAVITAVVHHRPPITPAHISMCGLCFVHFLTDPNTRGRVIQQGALDSLLKAASVSGTEPSDLRDLRRGMALCAMVTNPDCFSYGSALDLVPELQSLLTDSHELYQYEGCLGLTNLLARNEDCRKKSWLSKGWNLLRDCATSENDQVRAAGLEGLCNLSLCEDALEAFAANKMNHELSLLLAFLREDNVRAQRAAAGCLAMISQHPEIGQVMSKNEGFQSGITAVGDCLDLEFQKRMITLIRNLRKLYYKQNIDIRALPEEFKTVEIIIRELRPNWSKITELNHFVSLLD